MLKVSISGSQVLYKPDLNVLERSLFALHEAVQSAKVVYEISLELTLVDNTCDDSFQLLRSWLEERITYLPDLTIHLLRAPTNLGYGRANNLVIERSESDYHLVLNPDLFVEPDSLTQALNFMTANPDVGLLTPSVFGEDGERQFLCKRNPTLFIMFLRSFSPKWLRLHFKSLLDKFEMRERNYEEVIDDIQYPTGCCMFFRTNMLRLINGFDPAYFLHYEDADIGRRMLTNAKIVYVPSVRVIHLWGRDTHHSWKFRLVTVWSGLIYWRKWGGIFVSSSVKH